MLQIDLHVMIESHVVDGNIQEGVKKSRGRVDERDEVWIARGGVDFENGGESGDALSQAGVCLTSFCKNAF